MPPMSGCDRLPFGAEVTLRPDSWQAEAPVALDVEIGLSNRTRRWASRRRNSHGARVTLRRG